MLIITYNREILRFTNNHKDNHIIAMIVYSMVYLKYRYAIIIVCFSNKIISFTFNHEWGTTESYVVRYDQI